MSDASWIRSALERFEAPLTRDAFGIIGELGLAGLTALLEHNVRLNLVADRFPKGIEEH